MKVQRLPDNAAAYKNPAEALKLHREWSAHMGKPEELLRLAMRTRTDQSSNGTGYVANMARYVSSAYLWYATSGKAGFSFLHMAHGTVLLNTVRHPDIDVAIKAEIASNMALTPDPVQRSFWLVFAEMFGLNELQAKRKSDLGKFAGQVTEHNLTFVPDDKDNDVTRVKDGLGAPNPSKPKPKPRKPRKPRKSAVKQMSDIPNVVNPPA